MAVEVPPFCSDWDRYERREVREQKEYVASELRRLEAADAPVLPAVLGQLDKWCQFLAVTLLHDNTDPIRYEPILNPGRVWALRISADVRPDQLPRTDAQGRFLPKEKVGKVVVVKVGNIGGNIRSHDAHEAMQHGGDRRALAAAAGRPLYMTIEVGYQPTPVKLRDAILAMRQYGIGCTDLQYLGRREMGPKGETREDGAPWSPGQLQWLLEEVPPGELLTPRKAKREPEARAG